MHFISAILLAADYSNVDPIKGLENLAYAILGVIGVLVLLTVAAKSLGLLSKMAVQAIIGVLAVGALIILFTNGESSKELLQSIGDHLIQYMEGAK